MKPFDPKNWNRNAYHLYYRKEKLFKELAPVKILNVDSEGRVRYVFQTDQFYFRSDQFKVEMLNFHDNEEWDAEWSSGNEEFFELELEELTHFI